MTKTYPKTCFWAEPYGHSEDSDPPGGVGRHSSHQASIKLASQDFYLFDNDESIIPL